MALGGSTIPIFTGQILHDLHHAVVVMASRFTALDVDEYMWIHHTCGSTF